LVGRPSSGVVCRRFEQPPLYLRARAENHAVAKFRDGLQSREYQLAKFALISRMQGGRGGVDGGLLVVREGLCHEWTSRLLFGQVDLLSS
jgi:hypothetical protein